MRQTSPPPPTVLAVCLSTGGIPKLPQTEVQVAIAGIVGDLHAHAKHNRLDRAISLLDIEALQQLASEGFPLSPGATGENLVVEHLNVQSLPPGTLLRIDDVVLRLEAPRKPCYVLDAIDPRLKEIIIGRCGYMASVIQPGRLRQGAMIVVDSSGSSGSG